MSALAAAAARARRIYGVPGVPAAAFLSGLLFLFQPAQVYEGNAAFFPQYKLAQLLMVLVPAFLMAFAVLASIASLGGARFRKAIAMLLSGIAIAAWAGATFFTASKGLLDGRALLELADKAHVATNAMWMVGFAAAGAAVAYYLSELARRFFVVLFLLMTAQGVWIAAGEDKPWREAADGQRLVTMSPERNVLVVLLDGFQSDFLAEIFEREPSAARSLEGFTYFPHAVGAAPTTYVSMPVIHSGVQVRTGETLRDLYENAVVKDSFVARLAEAGYDTMLVNPVFGKCPLNVRCDNSDQIVFGRTIVALDSAALLLNLALFRSLPHAFKPAIYRGGSWWLPWSLETRKASTSNEVLERMAQELNASASRPTVRFLHLFNSHAPANLDAQCMPVTGVPWTRQPAIRQASCAMSNVFQLLDTLRKRDLYDRSAIVILADHGAGLPRDPVSGFVEGAQASPLLLVKPFGARHPLKVASSVVGLMDVSATVCGLTSSCRSNNGIDMMKAEVTVRAPEAYPFVSYVWRSEFDLSVSIDNYFEVRGPPGEVASWWRMTNLPAGKASLLDFAKSDPDGTYGFGWSEFEQFNGKSVRWAVGPQSDLYMNLDPNHDLHLLIDASTHGGNASQKMVIEVNGARIAEVSVGDSPSSEKVFVPARVLNLGANRLLFRFAQSSPPGPADPRKLAVLFDRIVVQQEYKH